MDAADDAVVSVVVGAGENLGVFLGDDLGEGVGVEKSVDRVTAGIGALGFGVVDRVQGGVEGEGSGREKSVLRGGSTTPASLRMCAEKAAVMG
jgi:hypothetical protein